jgi:GxxExxY protein
MTQINELHEYKEKKSGEIIFKELSYQIMKAVFEVHNTLGPGFIESIYEEALAHELALQHIPFERQKEVTIHYKDQDVGTHRLDLVVDGKVILELKAVTELTDVFKQQTLSYLKATGSKLGILINFGSPRAQYIRIVN